jgi:hypothetical protein
VHRTLRPRGGVAGGGIRDPVLEVLARRAQLLVQDRVPCFGNGVCGKEELGHMEIQHLTFVHLACGLDEPKF